MHNTMIPNIKQHRTTLMAPPNDSAVTRLAFATACAARRAPSAVSLAVTSLWASTNPGKSTRPASSACFLNTALRSQAPRPDALLHWEIVAVSAYVGRSVSSSDAWMMLVYNRLGVYRIIACCSSE